MTKPKKTGPGGQEYFHDFEHDLLERNFQRSTLAKTARNYGRCSAKVRGESTVTSISIRKAGIGP
jgi:hypothetical protein